ncbi:hypothetical protein B9Z55_017350 [Caenorhabditis nigoni]|uniref:Uncharacterized protein n=1 Tax=Caenorhabditis nigoni TaxID=1611254 RepID=A0A2G5T963_9PELO|nr:hypothetical protein B9Z55_017350 [Caenorhabditis nigoni]
MFFTCSPKVSKPPSEQQEDWSRLIGVKWKLQRTSGNQRPRLWMERWMGHQSQLEARTKKGEEIQADRSMRIKRVKGKFASSYTSLLYSHSHFTARSQLPALLLASPPYF